MRKEKIEMNLFRKNKIFSSIESFSLEEYIYLLNYTNELIKKDEQKLLSKVIESVLVIYNEDSFSKFIINLLYNLNNYCLNTLFVSSHNFLSSFYPVSILVNVENINTYSENVILINSHTFSVYLGLANVLKNRKYNESDYNIGKNEFLEYIDEKIVKYITDKVLEKKEFLAFLENNEIGNNNYLPLYEVFFLIIGTIIMLVRRV